MILGFAHITRNIIAQLGANDGIPNPREKWPLMAHQAASHRLSMRKNDDWFPTELVVYDTGVVEQASRLTAELDRIRVVARDALAEMEFFLFGLGFEASSGGLPFGPVHVHLSSQVQRWRVSLGIYHDVGAPIDPPLDIAGYAALAFYSSDVEADRDHLLKHGGRTPTEPFTVKLDREMKIVMLRSPEGTIIELIQVMP